jgi:type I restriction enzyme, S subunit
MSELTKDWKKVKLGDVAEFTNGGAWNSNEYTDSGISIVQVTNISNNTIVLDQCKFLLPESLMKYKKHMLFEGDLVIATVGSHPTQPNSVVGRVAIIPKFVQGSLLNQNAVRLSPKSKELDKKYLGHLGKSPFFRNYIIAHARGSANQVRMSIGLLKEMDIHLPPFFIQKKIASILSNYDDLIENNTRRIEILEEMAKLIYDEWFVKFRFPGHENIKMVPSELREIPERWNVKKLTELVKTQYGYTESATEEKIGPKFLRGKDINKQSYILWDEVPFCTITPDVLEKYHLKEGDIVVIRMADPGKVGIVETNINAVFASYLIRLEIIKELKPYYLFYFLRSDKFQNYITGASTGTTRKSASAGVITDTNLIIPPEHLLILFEERIGLLRKQLNLLLKKNQNLRKTRDLLLSKLISGEINVSEMDIRIRDEFQES